MNLNPALTIVILTAIVTLMSSCDTGVLPPSAPGYSADPGFRRPPAGSVPDFVKQPFHERYEELKKRGQPITQWKIRWYDDWEKCIYNPESFNELDLAYGQGLKSDPSSAFRAMLEGCFSDSNTPLLFNRRLQLIVHTLDPSAPTQDESLRQIAERACLSQSDHVLKDKINLQFTNFESRLRREVLAMIRSNDFSPALALLFEKVESKRQHPDVANEPDVAIRTLAFLAADDAFGSRLFEFSGGNLTEVLERRGNSDLSVAELTAFYKQILNRRRVPLEQLKQERSRLLTPLKSSERGRGRDDSDLMLLAGLHGTDNGIPEDLAMLVQQDSAAQIRRRLERPASRFGELFNSSQQKPFALKGD